MAKTHILRLLVNEEHPETGTVYIIKKPGGGLKAGNKIRLRKYDKRLKKHCWFVDKKMPAHSKN